MESESFSKISQDKQRNVLGLRVGQQVASVTLYYHTKPNGPNRSRFYVHRESQTAMSNFCEIGDFEVFAKFSKFNLTHQE